MFYIQKIKGHERQVKSKSATKNNFSHGIITK